MAETLVFRIIRHWQAILRYLDRASPVPCFPFVLTRSRVQVSVVIQALPLLLPISLLSTPTQMPNYYINVVSGRLPFTWFTVSFSLLVGARFKVKAKETVKLLTR